MGSDNMAVLHCWLLLGVVLTFGVAFNTAQASRANHYDFFVSRSMYFDLESLLFFLRHACNWFFFSELILLVDH
jgi:hypothetical protein